MTQSTENGGHDRPNHISQRSADPDVSRECAIERLHTNADRIKQRELRTALMKLDQHGTLTDAQRAIIVDMADALVDELLAPPTQSLRNASSTGRSDVRTALELFDPDTLSDE